MSSSRIESAVESCAGDDDGLRDFPDHGSNEIAFGAGAKNDAQPVEFSGKHWYGHYAND